MRSTKVWLACAAIVLVAVASYGSIPHVLYGKDIGGQVVDVDTGQPLAGVHVALLWESDITPHGFTAHNSRTICYHAAATITDPQGRFHIAPWREWSTYGVEPVDPIALVYARGYTPRQILPRGDSTDRPTNHLDERYALKKFEGTVSERIQVMWGGIANRGCMYGGKSQTSLFPMLKAIYEEGRSIAETESQKNTIRIVAQFAAEAGLARDPNGPVDDAPVAVFIEENLK